jgi:hypothetical protein
MQKEIDTKQVPAKFIIDGALAQQVLNYLQTRPYGEVFQMVAALVQMQSVDEGKEKVEGAKSDVKVK